MFTNNEPKTGLNSIKNDTTYFILNNAGIHGVLPVWQYIIR